MIKKEERSGYELNGSVNPNWQRGIQYYGTYAMA